MKTSPINISTLFIILPLLLLLLFPSLATADASEPLCNPQDQATLLKIQSHFGGPTGRLSSWDPSLNCCSDWDFVGCDNVHNPGRVSAGGISRDWGLSGTIPTELGDLPYLVVLFLAAQPNITGPIPQSMANLKFLQLLQLDSNKLTGPIPAFLGNLKSLTQINLSNNRFTGGIPPNWSNNLTKFDVSSNQLCGEIPTVLTKFGRHTFRKNKCLCGAPLPPC